MTIYALHSPVRASMSCYETSLPIHRITSFLGHDPQSKNWPKLSPFLRDIYKTKQRTTLQGRIEGLKTYIRTRIMDDQDGAFPAISIVQFEPYDPALISVIGGPCVRIEDDRLDTTRILIDGLARYTALTEVREELQISSPEHLKDLYKTEVAVSLYVPNKLMITKEEAGQLFSDFNSYAWAVPSAKSLAMDKFNPYKKIALIVAADGTTIGNYGGLKQDRSSLGGKDTEFVTLSILSQFCKVAVEGQKAIGSLKKPILNSRISHISKEDEAEKLKIFFSLVEKGMGKEKFGNRNSMFRQSHVLYAIATVLNDILQNKKASLEVLAHVVAQTEWSWKNEMFRQAFGKEVNGRLGPKLQVMTGGRSTIFLIQYLRETCGIPTIALSEAAA